MGITFAAYKEDACCLCGSTVDLTGEHKIKASLLRGVFGKNHMTIGHSGGPNDRRKFAPSVRSKAFHFKSRVCARCNNERTQAADNEFDRFHQVASSLLANGDEPRLVFNQSQFAFGSAAYLNVFRYFAKLLCCHLAELKAPRRIHLARFALGRVHKNCVWLNVGRDWTYAQLSAEIGPLEYAAHGGLVVYGDKKTGEPKAFHSTLTLGPVRYAFFSRLIVLERLELKFAHREFFEWCRAQARIALQNPLSNTELLDLCLSHDAERVE